MRVRWQPVYRGGQCRSGEAIRQFKLLPKEATEEVRREVGHAHGYAHLACVALGNGDVLMKASDLMLHAKRPTVR